MISSPIRSSKDQGIDYSIRFKISSIKLYSNSENIVITEHFPCAEENAKPFTKWISQSLSRFFEVQMITFLQIKDQ